MKSAVEAAEAPSFLDSLLDDFEAPKSFIVRMPIIRHADPDRGIRQKGGQIFFFRNWVDAEEFEDWKDAAVAWARNIVNNAQRVRPATALPEDWKPFLTTSPKIAITAHMIAFLSISPDFEQVAEEDRPYCSQKLEQLDALKMAKRSWTTLSHLAAGIEANKFIVGSDDLDERVDQEKKG